MNLRARIHSLVRPQPLPPFGFPLAGRLFLSLLPAVLALVDTLTRDEAIPPLMSRMSAIALAATTLALVAHHLLQRRLVRALAAIAALLAIMAVVQMGHLSAPLFEFWPRLGGFLWSLLPLFALIVSLTLFGSAGTSRRHLWATLSMCLGIAVCALAILGAIGELYEMLRWFELDEGTTRTLLMRGIAGASLGAALALGTTSMRVSLQRLRRWTYLPAAVLVLFLSILLAELLRLEEIRDLRAAVHAKTEQVVEQLDSRFDVSTHELQRIARTRDWLRGGTNGSWSRNTWDYVDTTSELKAVIRIDSTFKIEWAIPALKYPELKKGEQVDRRVPEAAHSLGRFSAEPMASGTVAMPDMGNVFLYLVPTLDYRMTDGFVVGFYHIGTLAREALGRSGTRFGVIVQDEEGRVVHDAGRADLRAASAYVVSSDWDTAGSRWRVHVFPRDEMLDENFTIMPLLVLALGVLLSGSFGGALYQTAFARASMRRLQREVRRRARLEEELREHQRNLEALVAQRTNELEASNRELERRARTDALTGVFNRGRFEEEFESMLVRARRFSRPLTLALIDLDHFKWINDTHGHGVGDEVLREVCAVCRPALREADVFARYGGEEFAVLMDEADPETALPIVERMRRTIEEIVFEMDDDIRLPITASFGVASLTPDIESRKELLDRADEALYRAKAGGRNRIEAWTPDSGSDDE